MTKIDNKKVVKKIIVHSGKISAMILKVIFVVGMVTVESLLSRPTYHFQTIDYKELWNEPLFGYPAIKPEKLRPQSVSTALQRLQKQGLVTHTNSQWTLTKTGKDFTKSAFQYKKFRNKKLLSPKDNIKRIVIFDIPEKEREKRDWLRGELVYHGYEPLQKSVWIGSRPLLPELIKTVDFLNMSSYVHVFSVKNEGTISYNIS